MKRERTKPEDDDGGFLTPCGSASGYCFLPLRLTLLVVTIPPQSHVRRWTPFSLVRGLAPGGNPYLPMDSFQAAPFMAGSNAGLTPVVFIYRLFHRRLVGVIYGISEKTPS